MTMQAALAGLPQGMHDGLRYAYNLDPEAADLLMQRGEMKPEVALMAGLASSTIARRQLEGALDSQANVGRDLPGGTIAEVVVGGGAHAAIYASVRRALGFPAPLVLEQDLRFGGVLAMTEQPSFFLNSRNRPGPLGAPGSREALNVIPGAPMQPSDLGGYEYQTNADLGLVIRCTLALNANLRQATVENIKRPGNFGENESSNRWIVNTDRGPVIAKRVLLATGLGEEKGWKTIKFDGKTVLSFSQFFQRFAQEKFPLRGLGRVAVAGGGDGAKTIVEALVGMGPTTGMSMASLDYIDRIDWYGAGAKDCTQWLNNSRTRYKRLAALFPRDAQDRSARVRPLPNAGQFGLSFGTVRVGAEAYDTLITAIGYESQLPTLVNSDLRAYYTNPELEKGERLAQANPDRSLFVIGGAAQLPYQDYETLLPYAKIAENQTALFRLAPRTAALASMLPGV